MIVTEITRTYSRSVNTRNYGAAESWVKVEATYSAQIESGDDPIKVSSDLYEQCRTEVAAGIASLVAVIKGNLTPATPAPSAGVGGPTPL